MTPEQILSRTRDLLRGLVWAGTSNKVFGPNAVYVTGETPIQNITQYPSPCAFVVDQGHTCHPEHPGLGTQNFSILVFIQNVANNYGEGGILGRNELVNTSQGKGTKEVGEAVLEEIIKQTVLSTDKVCFVAKSLSKPQIVSGNSPLYFFSLSFQAFCWVY